MKEKSGLKPVFYRLPSKRRAIDTNPKPLYNYFRRDTDNLIIVSEWWNGQTRTFEGRMPKGVRVQVPPPTPSKNRELRGSFYFF